MQANLSEELDLLDQLVKHHLKSYQVWCARPVFRFGENKPLKNSVS